MAGKNEGKGAGGAKGGNKFSLQQKKEYAKTLFISDGDITQKELAARVGVTEKTISSWIAEGLWHTMRKSLLTTKKDQLSRFYDILSALTSKIEETDFGDTKLADMAIKYTAAIRNLETETSVGQMTETGMAVIRFITGENLEDAKKFTEYFDAVIREKLKNI